VSSHLPSGSVLCGASSHSEDPAQGASAFSQHDPAASQNSLGGLSLWGPLGRSHAYASSSARTETGRFVWMKSIICLLQHQDGGDCGHPWQYQSKLLAQYVTVFLGAKMHKGGGTLPSWCEPYFCPVVRGALRTNSVQHTPDCSSVFDPASSEMMLPVSRTWALSEKTSSTRLATE
jgi:hypothetical protein